MTSTILPGSVRVIDDLHLGAPHIIATYLLSGDEPAICRTSRPAWRRTALPRATCTPSC
jgi:hypothetical protein